MSGARMHTHSDQIDAVMTERRQHGSEQNRSTKPTYWRKDIVHRQDGWPREHCRHVGCTHRRAENRKRLRMQAEG